MPRCRVRKWFEMMDYFYAAGGNLFDTSRIYGAGESEQVLGAWIESRGVRSSVNIITKCGHGGALAILPDQDFEEMVACEMVASLAALRTTHVELLLLHRDNPAVAVSRIVERLNREVEAGRAKSIGASNWSCERVDQANAYAAQHGLAGFTVVSNHLSLAAAAEPFYPRLVNVDAAGEAWHARTRIPLLSWSAAARGFFTGAYQPGMIDERDTFGQRMLQVYGSQENYARLCRAQELGVRKGASSATQVALSWLLRKPYPLIPVIGPRTLDELQACLDAAALELSPAECSWLASG
ncbi:MAG: aldo/keto reductase [Chloroflexi bacterium]|nr:aldo/keto reductase [Chloroflexota bacterium]